MFDFRAGQPDDERRRRPSCRIPPSLGANKPPSFKGRSRLMPRDHNPHKFPIELALSTTLSQSPLVLWQMEQQGTCCHARSNSGTQVNSQKPAVKPSSKA
ncbi:hypothetical protein HPB50_010150 [Hyalomma asiaticum]|uniref:Uncharacterized protein n=1 Tax=Hyalomma asiaticum TaxID=266040 RepID=A0ACB7T448_HYAAI|nr:hypothetical protein HPB50_010150 [Hyalomma asiaticum]